jgi:hypothetical protein
VIGRAKSHRRGAEEIKTFETQGKEGAEEWGSDFAVKINSETEVMSLSG